MQKSSKFEENSKVNIYSLVPQIDHLVVLCSYCSRAPLNIREKQVEKFEFRRLTLNINFRILSTILLHNKPNKLHHDVRKALGITIASKCDALNASIAALDDDALQIGLHRVVAVHWKVFDTFVCLESGLPFSICFLWIFSGKLLLEYQRPYNSKGFFKERKYRREKLLDIEIDVVSCQQKTVLLLPLVYHRRGRQRLSLLRSPFYDYNQ